MKSVPPERESLLILRTHRPRAFGSGQLPAAVRTRWRSIFEIVNQLQDIEVFD
jgi:hypothetical protein